MLITYIGHSGFMVELDNICLLFDYYKGVVPHTDKKMYIFSSHFHEDHFNPKIFSMISPLDITYVLSKEIRSKVGSVGTDKKIEYVKANEKRKIDSLTVETLKSTDCGVAFIVSAEDKTVFHAGDLNLWIWDGETKQYNNNMKANFLKYTTPLRGRSIDVGFIPLDPRLEKNYCAGMDCFTEFCSFGKIFPMHFWGCYGIIDRYKKERGDRAVQVEKIEYEGQTWEVKI